MLNVHLDHKENELLNMESNNNRWNWRKFHIHQIVESFLKELVLIEIISLETRIVSCWKGRMISCYTSLIELKCDHRHKKNLIDYGRTEEKKKRRGIFFYTVLRWKSIGYFLAEHSNNCSITTEIISPLLQSEICRRKILDANVQNFPDWIFFQDYEKSFEDHPKFAQIFEISDNRFDISQLIHIDVAQRFP